MQRKMSYMPLIIMKVTTLPRALCLDLLCIASSGRQFCQGMLRICRLGVIAGLCLQVLASHVGASESKVLFKDDFAGQSGAPANWWFGNSIVAAAPVDPEDTFAVVDHGAGNVLAFIDEPPVTDPSVPMFHTAKPVDFTSTGSPVLLLEADLTVNNNEPDYRLGVYNAVSPSFACSSNAYQMRIYPGRKVDNISLQTFSSTRVVDNVVGTFSQGDMRGSHHFALEVDFSTSTTKPTVRAYSDGILLMEITASAEGGFHPTGADGKAVRIMAQSTNPGYAGTGANFELDNVLLTALPGPSVEGRSAGK